MHSLEQFKNSGVDGIVTDLYALAFHLARQRRMAESSGLTLAAEGFDFAELVVCKIVGGLTDLDKELSAAFDKAPTAPEGNAEEASE